MELMIHPRKTVWIAVVLLVSYGLTPCSCKPLDSSNDTGCGSTSCSTTTPDISSKLRETAILSGNYLFNSSLFNQTKGDEPLDIRSSEFALLHSIIKGIINRFTEGPTGTESTRITELVDFITLTNDTEKSTPEENGNSSSSTIPPALFANLKILVPPFLSELLGRLTETFDRDLPEDEIGESKSNLDSVGFLESFRQTMLGLAQDKPKTNQTASGNETSDLKNELDGILSKLKQVQNPAAKKDKVDELCDMFDEHVNFRILSLNDTSLTNEGQANRIVVALKKTTDVVCSDGNKKMLKKLANSQKIWANRITKRVLARAIDSISKGKPLLRIILNLIMGIIVENPQRSQRV